MQAHRRPGSPLRKSKDSFAQTESTPTDVNSYLKCIVLVSPPVFHRPGTYTWSHYTPPVTTYFTRECTAHSRYCDDRFEAEVQRKDCRPSKIHGKPFASNPTHLCHGTTSLWLCTPNKGHGRAGAERIISEPPRSNQFAENRRRCGLVGFDEL